MNIKDAVKFNFTWSSPDGAWLQFPNGEKNWYGYSQIEKAFGKGWFEQQTKKQGIFTGCWVNIWSINRRANGY